VVNEILGAAAMLSRRTPVLKQFRFIINWGNSSPIEVRHDVKVFNPPAAIASAVNKLTAMSAMQAAGVRVPEFTTTTPLAARGIWLARCNLFGSGGDGIKVVREGETFPAAPLYVKYIPKLDEWRIHVAFGRAILAQKKLRQADNEQTPDQKLIRNHDNGWVFAPRDLDADVSSAVKDAAVKAVSAMGLDFGAVDLIVGKKDGLPYILEVNTAPGIESPTLKEAYSVAFSQAVQ
jgi:glutathione synthase/RimK-type ligase-like ATP-grasp enzyme